MKTTGKFKDKKTPKRILGIWENKMTVKWSDNDKLSEEEFLGINNQKIGKP